MADFTWVADFTILFGQEFNTIESTFENGVKQFRSRYATEIGQWRLTFKNRSLTETKAIQAFHKLKLGKATAFTWNCPIDGKRYTVRFVSDKFQPEYTESLTCNFDIELEEDIA